VASDADVERLAADAFVFIASEGARPYYEEALYLALRAGARYVGLLASGRKGRASHSVYAEERDTAGRD
jgi:xanthine/CO dehydrogenase XdhC/CoxF family maturation factor